MLLREAEALADRLVAWRRAIHRRPELGLETEETARLVEGVLDELGIPHRRFAETGVAGYLGRGRPGLALLLRADMDALPIEEDNDLPFKSEIPGRMHACGHDGHTAIALGAAALLKAHEAELPQPVVVIFQPGEEGPGGALPMIQAGVMRDPAVGAAMMVHADPFLPAGSVGFKPGYSMANIDDFVLRVLGRGGHGAHPDTGVDAVVAAAQIVVAAQTLVSRMTNPAEPAVLTFGTIHGGWRENVLADRVELTGTIRTFGESRRKGMEQDLRRLAASVAQAFGARVELEVTHGYPALYCDERMTERAREVATELLGSSRTVTVREPSLGGEDFAYFAQRVPATNCIVGVGNPDRPATDGLHSAKFLLDERALPVGAAVMAGVALRGIADIARPATPDS